MELITGYATNSLALVGDSYHMLSDVISLIIGERSHNSSIVLLSTYLFSFHHSVILLLIYVINIVNNLPIFVLRTFVDNMIMVYNS